jgi:hypothetical protein
MTARLHILAAAALLIAGCGDDTPTGNNNLDPTLPTNPCDSAMSSSVTANGFVMSGSGYQGQLVTLDASPDVEFKYRLDDAAIVYSISDTVALPDDANARLIIDVHMPSTVPGVYPFNNQTGDSASYVRVELRRRNIATKVYRSTEGRITFDSLVQGAQPYARFCGLLQDSLSRSQIAIMGGRLSPVK